MKKILFATLAASILAVPAISFAQVQNNGPVTRAEVKADLAALEQAGYDPNDWINYPQNIQAAEARVNAEQVAQNATPAGAAAAAQPQASNSYGDSAAGTSQSGISRFFHRDAASQQSPQQSTFFGH